MNRIGISDEELNERLSLSLRRMNEPFYDIDHVFAPEDAKWPGDKEGRALLAFVCLLNAGAGQPECLPELLEALPGKLNEKGYLGAVREEFFEQQLSGHSWLLRGLCEAYERSGDEKLLSLLNGIVENLYLPLTGKIRFYPVSRRAELGGVDGHTADCRDGWLLSTDTCCAFMSIDGLSHVYQLTRDERIRVLLDEMIDTFRKIDKREIKAQTHCTLTAARGMLRLYSLTSEEKNLDAAKEIFSLYVNYALTYTYENYNWWGRPDTWTEPCAVVDSLMLACELYKLTGEKAYRTYAARIYHNGFATIQRCNGGAGTSRIVYENREILQISGFEAKQCCSMRLAEGLYYIKRNKELLYAETTGTLTKDERGVYTDGDLVYAQTVGDDSGALHPLLKYYKLTEQEILNTQQRVVFRENGEEGHS